MVRGERKRAREREREERERDLLTCSKSTCDFRNISAITKHDSLTYLQIRYNNQLGKIHVLHVI